MNNETRDNVEKPPESNGNQDSVRSRFSNEFSESTDAFRNDRNSSGDKDSSLPILDINHEKPGDDMPDDKIGKLNETYDSAADIAEGLICRGGFGNETERKELYSAVRTALNNGTANELISEVNRLMIENGSKMNLDLKYLFSYKNMPPTVVYSLSLNSADCNKPIDQMTVQHQKKMPIHK